MNFLTRIFTTFYYWFGKAESDKTPLTSALGLMTTIFTFNIYSIIWIVNQLFEFNLYSIIASPFFLILLFILIAVVIGSLLMHKKKHLLYLKVFNAYSNRKKVYYLVIAILYILISISLLFIVMLTL